MTDDQTSYKVLVFLTTLSIVEFSFGRRILSMVDDVTAICMRN